MLTYIRSALRGLARDERGQTMVEYALIIALVAVVLVVALTTLGGGIGNTFQKITGSL